MNGGNMKKYKTGYTQGVYDMFHIGHLNLLKQAKAQCEYLIVGVNSDKLVEEYKKKTPIICQEDRKEIVDNIKGVDQTIIVNTLDKVEIWKSCHFDAVFIGDDWKGNERWRRTEEELRPYGAEVVYLHHTKGVSSTSLKVVREDSVQD